MKNVEKKVWTIPKMTDFWGIGNRMEKRLHNLSIFSIKELAQANPDLIKKRAWDYGTRVVVSR